MKSLACCRWSAAFPGLHFSTSRLLLVLHLIVGTTTTANGGQEAEGEHRQVLFEDWMAFAI